MARKGRFLPSYKVFSGERYGLNLTFDTKREAVRNAKGLRESGDKVRVTKEKGIGGEVIYATWLRKGRAKGKPWSIPSY